MSDAEQEALEEDEPGRRLPPSSETQEEVLQLRRGLVEVVDHQHGQPVAGAHRPDRLAGSGCDEVGHERRIGDRAEGRALPVGDGGSSTSPPRRPPWPVVDRRDDGVASRASATMTAVAQYTPRLAGDSSYCSRRPRRRARRWRRGAARRRRRWRRPTRIAGDACTGCSAPSPPSTSSLVLGRRLLARLREELAAAPRS